MSAQSKRALIAMSLGLSVCGSGWLLQVQGYRFNVTPSEPLGLWRQAAISGLVKGKLVSACLPLSSRIEEARSRGYLMGGRCQGNLAPIVKSIAALPGDYVNISNLGVAVNGHLLPKTIPSRADSLGRPLIPAFTGDRRINAGEVFLISDYSPRSFDSRYFGVIPTVNIVAEIRPVLTTKWKPRGF